MKIKYSTRIVSDMNKSIDFYKLLGFEVEETITPPNGSLISLMKGEGDVLIELIKDNVNSPGLFATGMLVDDINKEVESLKSKGIEFSLEPTEISVGYMAMFQDPDGINIVIIEHTK